MKNCSDFTIPKQSSFLDQMPYSEACDKLRKLIKSRKDISAIVKLNLRGGDSFRFEVFSISNRIIQNGQDILIPEDGRLQLTPTKGVTIAFLRAFAFIPVTDPMYVKNLNVYHKDGNKGNISLDNLSWSIYN